MRESVVQIPVVSTPLAACFSLASIVRTFLYTVIKVAGSNLWNNI